MEKGCVMPARRNWMAERVRYIIGVGLVLVMIVSMHILHAASVYPSVPPQSVAMYAIAYGASTFPESLLFADGVNNVRVPFGWLCYAVRYGNEWALIDTGFNDAGFVQEYELSEFFDPLALLKEQIGGRAENVRTIVITHHHFDHAGNLHRFPNADVHMHAEVATTLRLPENAWDCPGMPGYPDTRLCQGHGSVGEAQRGSSVLSRLQTHRKLHTFSGRWSVPITLGETGHHLIVEHVGGHAPGSCMVWLHGPDLATPPLGAAHPHPTRTRVSLYLALGSS